MNQNNEKHNNKTYIDYEIFNTKVRLVDNDNVMIIERDDAIDIAKSRGMSLVQIAYNKNSFPHSICKIIDYNKFKYMQQKKEKEAKKAARAAIVDTKEIIFSLTIDIGDKNTKISHIKKFLSDGKTKVKLTIKLKRNEIKLLEMAKDLMKDILSNFNGIAELDSNPTFNSGIISCIIRPVNVH